MLPKKKRVTKDLFETIMKKGGTVSTPLFVCRYLFQNTPQYAFVAPKSVVKQAPKRNKLRRQGYNALKKTPLKPLACIFFYKKQAKNAKFSEITNNISIAINKITC